MRRLLWSVVLTFLAFGLAAQSFEIGELQEVYKAHIGELVRVPVRVTNTTDKHLTLVIRRLSANLGGTQKNYYCPNDDCLDQRVEDFLIRLEPNETLTNFEIGLDAGLANGASSVKYVVFNHYNTAENVEFDLNFTVEERTAKQDIFTHPHIVLHDVYPNPVVDYAFVEYDMTNDEIEAKIVIHNILGSTIDEYDLPAAENRVKIRAESMNAGIYFYTLYLDNEGVVTRKLIVKK